MNKTEYVKSRFLRLEKHAWALAAVWSMLAAASLAWNIVQTRQDTLEAGRIQARISHEKDVIYRNWNAKYGGVYVPVSEETQPNPYLSHVSERDIKTPSGKLLTLMNPYRMVERDIKTPSGKLLTLMNPAYMTRKVHELAKKEYGILGHITSLKPIRLENAPDPWETKALQMFERGTLEASSRERIQGKDYMRLMRPLITEKGCLKCHAVHGYKLGDIRGGISVSIPMDPLWAIARMRMFSLSLGHILLWLMGLGGIVLGTQRLRRSQRTRKQVEEALLTAKERLEHLISVNPGIIYSGRGFGDFGETYISSNIKAQFGYESEEVLASPTFWSDHIHPDDRDKAIRSFENLLERGAITYEYRFQHKSGSYRYVHDELAIVRDIDGNPLEYIGHWTDITDRKHAEEALQRAHDKLEQRVQERTFELVKINDKLKKEVEERKRTEKALQESELWMRNIFNSLEEAVFVVSPERRLLNLNPAAQKMFGYSKDEIENRGTELLHVDQEHFVEFGKRINQAFGRGESAKFEFEAKRKNGEIFPSEHTVSLLNNESGESMGIVSVVRDVSERKQAEEKIRISQNRLKSVFDGISDPLMMLDKDMRAMILNKAAMDYYQITNYKDIIDKPCHQAFRGSSSPCEGCNVPSAVMNAQHVNFERKGFMDTNKIEQIVVYPIKERESEVGHAIIRISDITKARLMERQLMQSEKLASLGILISGIAHEINNPNNFITFNIPILKDYLEQMIPIIDNHIETHPDFEFFGMSYPEFRKDIFNLLENIEHGSKRITGIVSDLRDFSQKKDKMDIGLVDIKPVIRRGIAICQGKIKRLVKSFEVEIPEDLSSIYTDSGIIEQVLINLVINAGQAADKKNSWIRVRVTLSKTWRDRFILEVSDNGCGMDETITGKVFDPFFTTKSNGEGTGMGLYLCHSMVESLGGRIVVDSEPGAGSTFQVILPDKDRRQMKRL